MRTSVVLLTGVSREAMRTAIVGLQFDLPGAVVVAHHIHVETQMLERVVSDVTGLIERTQTHLEHACSCCAVRQDLISTLDRLARTGRWDSIVARLPVGVEAIHICNALADDPHLARRLRIATVTTVLHGGTVVDDLLGDALLVERGLHAAPGDSRGVGEVGCAMVEYADLVVTTSARDHPDADDVGRGTLATHLLATLARPDARIVSSTEQLDAALILSSLHHHENALAWTSNVRTMDLVGRSPSGVWSLDLRSARPFHPERLLRDLAALGGGRHRSRGCFWLPTRPGEVLTWDGAGGQLGIGTDRPWGHRAPFTRLVVTGVGSPPDHLHASFDSILLGAGDIDAGHSSWHTLYDGFEPWLGPIRSVA